MPESNTSETSITIENDNIYVISDLQLGDGTRSDLFSLGDSTTKRDHLRALFGEVREREGHLIIAGDLMDLQQGWSIDRIITANAILFRELSDLGTENRVTYIPSELDEDLSYYVDLLNLQIAHEVTLCHKDSEWGTVVQGHQFNPLIANGKAPKKLRTMHHLTERLLGTWIRFPLENFPTLENRIAFWLIHKLAWLSQDWTESEGWKNDINQAVQQAYANQIGDARRVWSTIVQHLQNEETSANPLLISGHSHIPGIVNVPNTNHVYINTGSWTFDSHIVLHLDTKTQQTRLFDWATQQNIQDEAYQHLQSKTPWDNAQQKGHFLQWWQQNYLGWFRFNGVQPIFEEVNE